MFNNSNLAFHLLCPSAPLYMIPRCFARLPAGELWRSLRVPLVVVGGNRLWQSCKLFLWRPKGVEPICPLPSTIPLSRPSRLLWAPYLSGLKGPGRPVSKSWKHGKKNRGCLELLLMCTKDRHKENGTKRTRTGRRKMTNCVRRITALLCFLKSIRDSAAYRHKSNFLSLLQCSKNIQYTWPI